MRLTYHVNIGRLLEEAPLRATGLGSPLQVDISLRTSVSSLSKSSLGDYPRTRMSKKRPVTAITERKAASVVIYAKARSTWLQVLKLKSDMRLTVKPMDCPRVRQYNVSCELCPEIPERYHSSAVQFDMSL